MRKQAIVLLILAVLAAAALVYSQYRSRPLKVSGFVEAYEIRIGSRVGGRVQKVLVDEGAVVKQGDTLVLLEPYDLNARRAQAAADLAAQTAEYDRLKSGYRGEEIGQAAAQRDRLAAQLDQLVHGPRKQEIGAGAANVRLAEAQLELAQQQLTRVQRAVATNAATQEELDQAKASVRIAEATLEVRQEEIALLKEGTRPEEIDAARAQLEDARQAWLLRRNGYRPEEIATAKAAADAAQAALKAIDEQITELTIEAPLDAVVEAVDLRPGDLVSANSPILSLMDKSLLWIRAYVPENHLDLQIGQPVPVTVDSFSNERFRGHVSFVAREAEFTPSNVQTPEERSKQVFRIKVTLDEGLERLRPGMSADVWLGGTTSEAAK
jgi:HlyD family secretion protein